MNTSQWKKQHASMAWVELVDEAEAQALIEAPNVSDSYDAEARDLDGEDVTVQACEIYESDKTPADYPDGDPYAPALWIAPNGWVWDLRGNLVKEGE